MQPSIYEQISGAPSAEATVDLFYERVWVYERVWADPALAGYARGIDRARLKASQRAFMTAVLDGSERLNGRARSSLGVIDATFQQLVTHLMATLSELGVDEGTISEIAGGLAPLRADITAGAVDGP